MWEIERHLLEHPGLNCRSVKVLFLNVVHALLPLM